MGRYLLEDSKGNPLPKKGKALALVVDGGIPTSGAKFEPNLICVGDSGTFEAAIYCYDQTEYNRVAGSNAIHDRKVLWLIHPDAELLAK